jgi:hypothetical protein
MKNLLKLLLIGSLLIGGITFLVQQGTHLFPIRKGKFINN